jgi:putative ATPase
MKQSSLTFSPPYEPLAARMRPTTLHRVVGQTHLLQPGMPLHNAIDKALLHSMILWGPPGTGKTTLAQLMAEKSAARFERLSAITCGVKEIRQLVNEAQGQAAPMVLFIDEVHRFNKAQQDVFLPHIENGTFILIGATTENPAFELNNALLSRMRVYVLKRLTDSELLNVLQHALEDNVQGLGKLNLDFPLELQKTLVEAADGDTRQVLNLLEILSDAACQQDGRITKNLMTDVLQTKLRHFDKHGDSFYDQISALHKSIRGSSPDAALYWLCRMLDGGCDPLYIARRLLRVASEDIGLADPRALDVTLNAYQIYERLGSPEGELALAEAVLYLACASKSNAAYVAFNHAMQAVKSEGAHPVPLHLRNAPTKLSKSLNHGASYRYAHDEPHGYAAGESYFPDTLPKQHYYHPVSRGLEEKIAARLAYFSSLDAAHERGRG